MMAIEATKNDGYNYNVILSNPNDKGEFDLSVGSTYEFVADSYFDKPRPNAIRLFRTNDLLQEEETEKLINSFSPDSERMKRMEEIRLQDIQMEVEMNSSSKNNSKLKKGLSVVELKVDGIKYKQGKSGLERVTGTNRNDLCICGSGIKFKKCCGK